jgi:hypothetical protein
MSVNIIKAPRQPSQTKRKVARVVRKLSPQQITEAESCFELGMSERATAGVIGVPVSQFNKICRRDTDLGLLLKQKRETGKKNLLQGIAKAGYSSPARWTALAWMGERIHGFTVPNAQTGASSGSHNVLVQLIQSTSGTKESTKRATAVEI